MKAITIGLCSLALLAACTGCATVRPPSLPTVQSFSPPVTPPPSYRVSAPPELESRPMAAAESADVSVAIASQVAGRPSRADSILREAEWHFQAGKRHYQEDDVRSARREFDRALEALLNAPEEAAGTRGAIERKLEELVQAIHRLDLAGLGAADSGEQAYEKSPLEDIPQLTFPVDPQLKNRVREEVRATVSQLPLQVTDAVLSYINYFSGTRGRKTLLFGLKRSGRYRPLIQRILDEEGVPQELIFAAQIESAFFPRAVSRKKAKGMWQFMDGRGREYGLMQSPLHDDRFDPEKATRAAARHFRDLYQRYGDWYLALAAYNCGPGVVDKAVERTGYADFWELSRRTVLPRDTINYVPIILAMTIMVKNAKEHGLDSIEVDPPVEYETLDLSAPTSLALLSDLTEAPLPELRELNPALLKDVAPAGVVRIPRGAAANAAAALETIPAERRDAWRAHRVTGGDTLAAVARRYKVTESALAAANPSLSGTLTGGELLLVPAAPQRFAPAKRAAVTARAGRSAKARSAVKTASKTAKTGAAKASRARRPAAPASSRIALNARRARSAAKP